MPISIYWFINNIEYIFSNKFMCSKCLVVHHNRWVLWDLWVDHLVLWALLWVCRMDLKDSWRRHPSTIDQILNLPVLTDQPVPKKDWYASKLYTIAQNNTQLINYCLLLIIILAKFSFASGPRKISYPFPFRYWKRF